LSNIIIIFLTLSFPLNTFETFLYIEY
jgi:hypothetical protein